MLTKIRKRSALLLSLAVVCATVAIVPQTAGAAASKNPNILATTYTGPASLTIQDACPMTSAPAAGFSDTTSTDVDCIKMFGITQGTTADTYEPDANIPRWQMALFIHRMFVPTGMAAAGITAVPAFTDTSGLSDEIKAAISALASHGITLGTSATTFSPDDNVTRAEMALFLYRFASIVGATDDATPSGITMNIGTGTYNYGDIATQGFEAMEAIIGLYNAGVTGETCTTAATRATCSTTYRPNDDITRAEMASMIKELLDHTNARPAGVTIQSSATPVAGGGAEGTIISVRNADFTPSSNIFVDEFYQVRNDTSAATQALSIPFVALSGLPSSAAGTGVSGTGATGTIDSADKITNAKGNVTGAGCNMTAAAQTCRSWVWTAAQGTIYVDGSTDGFYWESSLAPGSTVTYATAAASVMAGATLRATCNAGGTLANVTATDGECAYQGTTVGITTTFTGATTAAVIDGYTVKYTDKVVNYGGGTGLETVSYNTTYVPTVSGVATFDVVCSADPKPLTNNLAIAGVGGTGALEYYESHEVTVDLGTAALGTGYPALGADITPTGNTDVTCEDVPRAYADTYQTLTVGKNHYAPSTAGSLATVTAMAHDQYGDGVAGITVGFNSNTKKNVDSSGIGGSVSTYGVAEAATGVTAKSILLTGSDGKATLSAVVCDTASVGDSGSHDYTTVDVGGGTEMSSTAHVNVSATSEGTTIYCAKAGVDSSTGVTGTTMNANVANVAGNDEKQLISFVATSGGGASDPDEIGEYFLSLPASCGAKSETDMIDGDDADTVLKARIEALTCVNTVTITLVGAGTTYTGYTVSMLADTGDWPQLTLREDTGDDALVLEGQAAGGTALNATVATSNDGAYGTTFDFIDHDADEGSLVTVRTVKERSATGTLITTTSYDKWLYDATDAFTIDHSTPGSDTQGATLAQFNAAAKAYAGFQDADMQILYRIATTGTGVSAISLTIG